MILDFTQTMTPDLPKAASPSSDLARQTVEGRRARTVAAASLSIISNGILVLSKAAIGYLRSLPPPAN